MQTQMIQYQSLQQIQTEMLTLQQRYYQVIYGGGIGLSGGLNGVVNSSGPFGTTSGSSVPGR